MMRLHRRLLALSACAALGLFASSAAAQEAPVSAAGAVVRPAPTLTDPQTGAQVVHVPIGCTATRSSSGQVVVLCPFAAPGAETAASTAPRTETKWYGWQTLLVDGVTSTTGLLLIGSGNYELQDAGLGILVGGYALGGPVVHWANGQVGKGFASLGLRVGAPLVAGLSGALVGAAFSGDSCGGRVCNDTGVAVGAVLGTVGGVIAALVIDTAVLARKTVKVEPEVARARAPKLTWTPTAGFDSKRQAANIGISGTF